GGENDYASSNESYEKKKQNHDNLNGKVIINVNEKELEKMDELWIEKKSMIECNELAIFEKVWENYFCPFEWRAQDYDYQAKDNFFLPMIDSLKCDSKRSSSELFLTKVAP
ncbi:2731_t:CDS:2, partial [Diversispora eburnea]